VCGGAKKEKPVNRREFLRIGGISAAALALGGCARPVETALVSQVDMPEFRLPGKARYFATTCQDCRGGCGVAVKVVDGRAKKIEGIPTHPISHGKVCARGQSVLQALYNPDRLFVPRRGGKDRSWDEVLGELAGQMQAGT
jgi:anaerobic selenocysteine-containing dehydrogenase